MSSEQFDDVLVRLRDLYRQAEDVYELRSIDPHYVEMDQVMSALSSGRATNSSVLSNWMHGHGGGSREA